MKSSTLFLIQSNYAHTDQIWSELQQIAHINDSIVVMGDAVLKLNSSITHMFHNIYCLDTEKSLLSHDLADQVQILQYNQFADLVLAFERCVSLK